MKSYGLEFSWLIFGKIGQGQPKVTIWTILVLLQYPMLHINFQSNQSIGSREEEF